MYIWSHTRKYLRLFVEPSYLKWQISPKFIKAFHIRQLPVKFTACNTTLYCLELRILESLKFNSKLLWRCSTSTTQHSVLCRLRFTENAFNTSLKGSLTCFVVNYEKHWVITADKMQIYFLRIDDRLICVYVYVCMYVNWNGRPPVKISWLVKNALKHLEKLRYFIGYYVF